MKETGIGITNPLFFIGVVEDNNDTHFEGRVKVRAFGIHGDNTEVPAYDLPWAICAKGDYDPNGLPPPLNSFVYGMFLDGRAAQHPLVLGLIPSQFAEPIDPALNGWGVIPNCHGEHNARGSTPQDFGQPQNSRLARGENLEETYVLQQEMNRVEDVYIAGQSEEPDEDSRTTWSEPNPAYGAKYPYNRVIETAKHSIEIDDTPGAERIMIFHKEGSYVQIDSNGTQTHKTTGDKYEINDKQQHVYVGGPSMVTINSDAYVYVNGNKTEEIEGNYNLIVHGNAHLGIAQSMFINAGNQLQMRGADVMLDANVSTMELFAKKEMKQTAGIDFSQDAQKMFFKTSKELHGKSEGIIKFESKTNFSQESTEGELNIKSAEDFKMYSGENVHIRAGDNVNVDPGGGSSIIDLANGSAATASSAGASDAQPAEQTQIPEPPAPSTPITSKPIQSENNPGALATDDEADPSHAAEGENYFDNLGVAQLEKENLTLGNTYIIGGVNYTLESNPSNPDDTSLWYFAEQ